MADNIQIDVQTTVQNIDVNVTPVSAASFGIEYSYPAGPQGPQGQTGTLSAHGYTHLNVSKAFFSGDIATFSAYASFSGTLVDDITITIIADNVGTIGNEVYLYFNGNTNVDTVISEWNQDNPGNTITLISGNGQLTPEEYQDLTLSGGIDSEIVYIVINANNYGSAGNNISLTFNGSTSIGTTLSSWNSANPSNKAALGIGYTQYSSTIPDSSVVITLSSGVDGIDPVFNQNLNTTNSVSFNSVLVNLDNVDPRSPNNKLQAQSLTVLGNDPVGGQPTTTVLKGGAFFGAADGTRGIMVEKQTALGDAIYFTGLNDQITQYNNILFTTGFYPQLWLQSGTGYVGVGTNTPNEKLHVVGNILVTGVIYTNGDVEITDSTKGIIHKSPDGNRWRTTITNSGILTSVQI